MYTENDWYNYHPPFEDYLAHYGRSKLDGAPGRGSGRYALGSGEHPRAGRIAKQYKDAENAIYGLADDVKRRNKNIDKKNKAMSSVSAYMDRSARQRIKDAFDEFKKADKYSEDYEKHEYEYKVKALNAMREKYPSMMDDETYELALMEAKDNPKTSWLMIEDWDQGKDSSFNLYLKDKGLSGDVVYKQYLDGLDKFFNVVENEVQTVLGSYGKIPIYDTSEEFYRNKGYDQETINMLIDTNKRRTVARDMATEMARKDYIYSPKNNTWLYTWML